MEVIKKIEDMSKEIEAIDKEIENKDIIIGNSGCCKPEQYKKIISIEGVKELEEKQRKLKEMIEYFVTKYSIPCIRLSKDKQLLSTENNNAIISVELFQFEDPYNLYIIKSSLPVSIINKKMKTE